MIVQPWPLYYQALAGLHLEPPEVGDQTPPLRAEPNTWMWRTPFFLGDATPPVKAIAQANFDDVTAVVLVTNDIIKVTPTTQFNS